MPFGAWIEKEKGVSGGKGAFGGHWGVNARKGGIHRRFWALDYL